MKNKNQEFKNFKNGYSHKKLDTLFKNDSSKQKDNQFINKTTKIKRQGITIPKIFKNLFPKLEDFEFMKLIKQNKFKESCTVICQDCCYLFLIETQLGGGKIPIVQKKYNVKKRSNSLNKIQQQVSHIPSHFILYSFYHSFLTPIMRIYNPKMKEKISLMAWIQKKRSLSRNL